MLDKAPTTYLKISNLNDSIHLAQKIESSKVKFVGKILNVGDKVRLINEEKEQTVFATPRGKNPTTFQTEFKWDSLLNAGEVTGNTCLIKNITHINNKNVQDILNFQENLVSYNAFWGVRYKLISDGFWLSTKDVFLNKTENQIPLDNLRTISSLNKMSYFENIFNSIEFDLLLKNELARNSISLLFDKFINLQKDINKVYFKNEIIVFIKSITGCVSLVFNLKNLVNYIDDTEFRKNIINKSSSICVMFNGVSKEKYKSFTTGECNNNYLTIKQDKINALNMLAINCFGNNGLLKLSNMSNKNIQFLNNLLTNLSKNFTPSEILNKYNNAELSKIQFHVVDGKIVKNNLFINNMKNLFKDKYLNVINEFDKNIECYNLNAAFDIFSEKLKTYFYKINSNTKKRLFCNIKTNDKLVLILQNKV